MQNESEQARPRPRLLRRYLGRTGLVVLSVAFLLGLLEIAFRIAGYEPIYDVYSEPSLFWQHDALLGWTQIPGAEGIYVGPRPWPVEFRAPVKINSLGLRGPELAPLPPGGYRILMLSDSLVAGFEVAFPDTFVARVEQRLNRAVDFPIQVVNAGVRGYGTDQEHLWYREHGRQLRPDLVVAFMSQNDADDNTTLHRTRRLFGKAAFSLRENGELELRGHPIPTYPVCAEVVLDERFEPVRLDGLLRRGLCTLEMGLSDRSAFFTWLTQRIRNNPRLLSWLYRLTSPGRVGALSTLFGVNSASADSDASPSTSAPYRLTTALLIELMRSVRASGARFELVVTSGDWKQLDTAALERAGIEPIFGGVSLRPEDAQYLYFRNDAHLNETGHDVMARALSAWLEPGVRAAREATPPAPDPNAPPG